MQFKCKLCTILLLLSAVAGSGRAQSTDSVQKIREVVIRAYLSEQPILSLPASVSLISSQQLQNQPGISLLPAMNTVPGVRMEERSPGSYRLSIRGSLLRSPFGVRNVKVYLDEFPLTDAGGNTYLNSLDVGSIHSMEVLKGPDGSLFGANSGGVVIINPTDLRSKNDLAEAQTATGSYGMFQEKIALRKQWSGSSLNINHSYLASEGYRDHSRLGRNYTQAVYRRQYAQSKELRFLAFYSDLEYQTPGGLTLAQFQASPASARPSTATVRGPEDQRARIENKTFYSGLVHEARFNDRFKHVIAVFGTITDFRNPFISNYEVREENTAGVRSYIELRGNRGSVGWTWNAGAELQRTNVDFANYDNELGVRGALQAQDDIRAGQNFYFSRFAFNLHNLTGELALSYNNFSYKFDKDLSTPASRFTRKFDPELMPRFALSYQMTPNSAIRATVSRGYSTPTSGEVRASDNIVNTSLESETGWNYEGGLRLSSPSSRMWIDLSVFNYRLSNAIVRRVNADDTEFYLNAGGTVQNGLETQFSYWLIEPVKGRLINGLQMQTSYTLSDYRFDDYLSGAENYSGNRLTGTPESVWVSSIDLMVKDDFYLFAQHNFSSRIPLNDANSVYSNKYDLIHLKAGWKKTLKRNTTLEIYTGVDNLLNENYSLGNDLNAFGGRYFNAAPLRNFFAGVRLGLSR